ncbi:hypothetical protein L914_13967, partial [Phytophthora nicotianae]
METKFEAHALHEALRGHTAATSKGLPIGSGLRSRSRSISSRKTEAFPCQSFPLNILRHSCCITGESSKFRLKWLQKCRQRYVPSETVAVASRLPRRYEDVLHRLEACQGRYIDQEGRGRHTGNDPLTFLLYCKLAEQTLHLDDNGFAHLFLLSQWN